MPASFPNKKNVSSPFPQQRETIPDGKDDGFHPGIRGHQVVEGTNALGLVVMVVGGVYHVAVPQGIVRQDETALAQHAQRHLVGLHVVPLVTVYECHIENDSQFGSFLYGVAYAEVYLVGHVAALYPRTGKVFHLVVYLESVELAVFGQSLGQAYSTVTAESPHLENVLWASHLHQHAQQSALYVSAGHAPVDGVDIGGAPQPIQIFALRLYMALYVMV